MNNEVRQFDLNIEKVLEHWTVAHALREIIANALDEQALTKSADPQIFKDATGTWHIKDSGRGLRYEHLTQNENDEKLNNAALVIGKFGVGLKDAFATFDRHHIRITIFSHYGDITIGQVRKHGFDDILTLHAMIHPASDVAMVGTDIALQDVKDEDMAEAKRFFLTYSGDQVLEHTRYGDVLQKYNQRARIYVNGLCVAEEEKFLFSYNITSLTTPLRKALNRERTHVGRSAYTDCVKAILLDCASPQVAQKLTNDLTQFETGEMHDELQWTDVATHACRILNAKEKVVFVTAEELRRGGSLITHAQQDGYRAVVVPGSLAVKLRQTRDIQNQPMRDLHEYQQEWNQSFQFRFVSPDQLQAAEHAIYALTPSILSLLGQPPLHTRIRDIRISETMRLNVQGVEALGVWEQSEQRIVIRRDQLRSIESYAAVLLHEATHARTGADDLTLSFEQGLTHHLGQVAAQALAQQTATTEHTEHNGSSLAQAPEKKSLFGFWRAK